MDESESRTALRGSNSQDNINNFEDEEEQGVHPLFAQYNRQEEEYFKTRPSDSILQGFVIAGRATIHPKVRR